MYDPEEDELEVTLENHYELTNDYLSSSEFDDCIPVDWELSIESDYPW